MIGPVGTERVYVQESIFEQVAERLAEYARTSCATATRTMM